MPWFEWPWALLLLLVVPWVVIPWIASRTRRQDKPALGFNRVFAGVPRSRRERWLRLPAILRTGAIVLLILALAGPRLSGRRVREVSKTIGLQLVVDCSGSMNARDMLYLGRKMSRIDVVREVSRAFVFGDDALAGRTEDMIGVIAFAEEPVTLCPLTLAHENLRPVIAGLHIGANADGTAIGDAIAVAAARIRQAETSAGDPFKSKAIILITDGENNSGARTPEEAALLAKEWGVRIYAIGIRPGGGASAIDALAKTTGGFARMVTDGSALREVYREIDQLERSDRQVSHSSGWEWIYALGAAALAMLAVEVLVSQTWLRRIP